jgi:RNA polymerase sigma-70 factor (ECF subfamily)
MPSDKPTIRASYLTHRAQLLRFLTQRTRDPEIAQDLLQETWLRIASGTRPAATIENPRAYLFQIASNLTVDYFRAEGRRVLRADEVETLLTIADEQPGPEAVAIGRSDLAVIAAALQEMPERRRAILVMSRLHGRTHRAIADYFGISTRTVEFEIVRALRVCGARLYQGNSPDSDIDD